MNLLLQLGKSTLQDIQNDLTSLSLSHNRSERHSLDAISLLDFCYAFLKSLYSQIGKDTNHDKLVKLLCQVFDSVDADCRGIITWTDLTNYCLRIGRNRFRASVRQNEIEYSQRMDFVPIFPVRNLCFVQLLQLLFCFDNETNLVRVFGKDGQIGQFSPAESISTAIKIKMSGLRHLAAKPVIPNVMRSTVTCLTYVERRKQLVVCCSDGYISWWDYLAGHMIGFVFCEVPQMGICYVNSADTVLTWAEDAKDFSFRIWDMVLRKLKKTTLLHRSQVLTVCEMGSHGVIASSSLDRSLIVWSSSLLLSDGKLTATPLEGHHHAIRSLAYAPDHDLVLGAGFDFDVFGWDRLTLHLQIRLCGHRHCVVAVIIVYTPVERAVTADEGGAIKIWNIDRALGSRAEILQSFNIHSSGDVKLTSLVSGFKNGTTIIVGAERLFYFDLITSVLEDLRPVTGGLGISQRTGRLWMIGRSHICVTDLITGAIIKRMTIMDEDRTDSTTSTQPIEKTVDVSAVAQDPLGKKIFLGTLSGRVLLFETGTFGLLTELTSEPPNKQFLQASMEAMATEVMEMDVEIERGFPGASSNSTKVNTSAMNGQKKSEPTDPTSNKPSPTLADDGSVVSLFYVARDELVVAVYSNGVIKILNGCHRVVNDHQSLSGNYGRDFDDDIFDTFPGSGGGKPPSRPRLLREMRNVHNAAVLSAAVSEKFNLIATSSIDFSVRVFDYLSLTLVGVFMAPKIYSSLVEIAVLTFLPNFPLLLGGDARGRVTAWTVPPLAAAWTFTWSVTSFNENTASEMFKEVYHVTDSESHSTSSTSQSSSAHRQSSFPTSAVGITSLEAIDWCQRPNKKMDNTTGSETANSSMNPQRHPYRLKKIANGSTGKISSSSSPMSSSRDLFQKGVKSRKNTKGSISNGSDSSVFNDLFTDVAVIVGDELGHIYVFDISKLLTYIDGVTEVMLKPPRPVLSAVYQQQFRVNVLDGIMYYREEIQEMLKCPLGSEASSTWGGLNGISMVDIVLLNRWNAHNAGISNVIVIQEKDTVYPISPLKWSTQHSSSSNHTSYYRPNEYDGVKSQEPHAIFTSSELGEVRCWTFSGTFKGQMTDDTNTGSMPTLPKNNPIIDSSIIRAAYHKHHDELKRASLSALEPTEIPAPLSLDNILVGPALESTIEALQAAVAASQEAFAPISAAIAAPVRDPTLDELRNDGGGSGSGNAKARIDDSHVNGWTIPVLESNVSIGDIVAVTGVPELMSKSYTVKSLQEWVHPFLTRAKIRQLNHQMSQSSSTIIGDENRNKILLNKKLGGGKGEDGNDDDSGLFLDESERRARQIQDYEDWRLTLQAEGEGIERAVEVPLLPTSVEAIKIEVTKELRKMKRKKSRVRTVQENWQSKVRFPHFNSETNRARKGALATFTLDLMKTSVKKKTQIEKEKKRALELQMTDKDKEELLGIPGSRPPSPPDSSRTISTSSSMSPRMEPGFTSVDERGGGQQQHHRLTHDKNSSITPREPEIVMRISSPPGRNSRSPSLSRMHSGDRASSHGDHFGTLLKSTTESSPTLTKEFTLTRNFSETGSVMGGRSVAGSVLARSISGSVMGRSVTDEVSVQSGTAGSVVTKVLSGAAISAHLRSGPIPGSRRFSLLATGRFFSFKELVAGNGIVEGRMEEEMLENRLDEFLDSQELGTAASRKRDELLSARSARSGRSVRSGMDSLNVSKVSATPQKPPISYLAKTEELQKNIKNKMNLNRIEGIIASLEADPDSMTVASEDNRSATSSIHEKNMRMGFRKSSIHDIAETLRDMRMIPAILEEESSVESSVTKPHVTPAVTGSGGVGGDRKGSNYISRAVPSSPQLKGKSQQATLSDLQMDAVLSWTPQQKLDSEKTSASPIAKEKDFPKSLELGNDEAIVKEFQKSINDKFKRILATTTTEQRIQMTMQKFENLMKDGEIETKAETVVEKRPFVRDDKTKKAATLTRSQSATRKIKSAQAREVSDPSMVLTSHKMDGNKSRYGIYRPKEVLLFLELLNKIRAEETFQKKLLIHQYMTKWEKSHDKSLNSELAKEERMLFPVATLLALPEIAKHTSLREGLEKLLSQHQDEWVTLTDLLQAVFPFSSGADRRRMESLAFAKQSLEKAIIQLIPPPQHENSSSYSAASRSHSHTPTVQFHTSAQDHIPSNNNSNNSNHVNISLIIPSRESASVTPNSNVTSTPINSSSWDSKLVVPVDISQNGTPKSNELINRPPRIHIGSLNARRLSIDMLQDAQKGPTSPTASLEQQTSSTSSPKNIIQMTQVEDIKKTTSTGQGLSKEVIRFHPKKGVEGWILPLQSLEELRASFDWLYEAEDGTVTASDIIDILQTMPRLHSCEQIQHIESAMYRYGFNLSAETTGQDITGILKHCLKIKVHMISFGGDGSFTSHEVDAPHNKRIPITTTTTAVKFKLLRNPSAKNASGTNPTKKS